MPYTSSSTSSSYPAAAAARRRRALRPGAAASAPSPPSSMSSSIKSLQRRARGRQGPRLPAQQRQPMQLTRGRQSRHPLPPPLGTAASWPRAPCPWAWPCRRRAPRRHRPRALPGREKGRVRRWQAIHPSGPRSCEDGRQTGSYVLACCAEQLLLQLLAGLGLAVGLDPALLADALATGDSHPGLLQWAAGAAVVMAGQGTGAAAAPRPAPGGKTSSRLVLLLQALLLPTSSRA